MVHGLLLNGGNEFLIRLSPETVVNKAEVAAATTDTDTVRDSSSGGGRAMGVSSTGTLDVALMTEADTYRDFHSAFQVSRGILQQAVCLTGTDA
jgi:hypothetical protein